MAVSQELNNVVCMNTGLVHNTECSCFVYVTTIIVDYVLLRATMNEHLDEASCNHVISELVPE